MRVTCYRIDPPSLIEALTDPALLTRYQDQTVQEVKSLADRALLGHLKRMSGLTSQVQAHGFEAVARHDLAGADALLTELFAVATWHQWDLPIEALGEQDLPLDGLPRGLLAADAAPDNAGLWLVDGRTLALARDRKAGDDADLDHHKQFHEPGHSCGGPATGCGS